MQKRIRLRQCCRGTELRGRDWEPQQYPPLACVRPRCCQNGHVPRVAAAGTITKILESSLIQQDFQQIPAPPNMVLQVVHLVHLALRSPVGARSRGNIKPYTCSWTSHVPILQVYLDHTKVCRLISSADQKQWGAVRARRKGGGYACKCGGRVPAVILEQSKTTINGLPHLQEASLVLQRVEPRLCRSVCTGSMLVGLWEPRVPAVQFAVGNGTHSWLQLKRLPVTSCKPVSVTESSQMGQSPHTLMLHRLQQQQSS